MKFSKYTKLNIALLIVICVLVSLEFIYFTRKPDVETISDNFTFSGTEVRNLGVLRTVWESDDFKVVIRDKDLYWETVDTDNTVYKMKVTKKRNSDDGQATIKIGDKIYQGCSVYCLDKKE
jgi:hypothetical protein